MTRLLRAVAHAIATPARWLGEKWADADRRTADWGREAWWDEC